MAGVFEQAMPERAFVIDCDAKVHQVIELDNPTDIDAAEACRRAVGGGGTCFEPAFRKLDELGIVPDCLVYLTDGYGSFPDHPPAYPVIWAIIPGGRNSCPWGEVVKVEV
jgi:predicted metal-dependent peptidase